MGDAAVVSIGAEGQLLLTLDDVRPDARPAGGSAAAPAAPQAPPRVATQFLEVMLYLCILSSFFTVIQPAPYEALSALLGLTCIPARVRVDAKVMPMIFMLIILQIGGIASLIPILGDKDAQNFVVISLYLTVSGMIFGVVMVDDTLRRFELVFKAHVLAAVIAAILGIIGYFSLVPGSEVFMMNARAVSTFKDPNLTGSFYIPPLLFLEALFLTGRIRPLHLVAFLIISIGLLLAFSRAAWGQFATVTILLWVLLFITRPDSRARRRMMLVALAMVIALVVLVSILFSFEDVRTMILQRATLLQSYDTGTEGSRFNIQQRSIEEILNHPNGMGPWVFGRVYGLVSHNSYLGVFLNHGWLGGFAYLSLTFMTLVVGFRSMFVRTPWQVATIAVLASYVGICLESIIVDTDHWRNYYLLVGLVWGMFAATANYQARARAQASA